jgi:hypothetical protein
MSDRKITNTEDTWHGGWIMGGNPGAIEAQEAQGQKELVASSQLPRKCNSPRNIDLKRQYKEMGIKVNDSDGDPLFFDAVLPKGWELRSTDHDMWNGLFDDKGRERATIFYKAAFYDRDSFINFNCRYYITSEYVEKEEGDKYHPKYVCVKDHATGEELFKTEVTKEYEDSHLRVQCTKWLKKKYPKYEKITAYWN